MTDLIDRQDAIVTAVRAAVDWHKLANPQYSIAYCIGEAMRQLPSAQPEKRTNERTETHARDCISRQAAIDALCKRCYLVADDDEPCTEKCNDIKILEKMPSAEKPFKLPEIYVADGYDTVADEDGNVGFGVYVSDENQIYVAGDVDNEVRLKALFHELCHWVQDMCGRPFDEDEANRFAEVVYDALPSAQPEIIRCKDCKKWHTNCLPVCGKHGCDVISDYTKPDDFCAWAERRTDG